MKSFFLFIVLFAFLFTAAGQQKWKIADADFGNLPKGVHVFFSNDSLNGKAFRAFYASIDLKNKNLIVETDTTVQRRLTPQQFFDKNNKPVLIVNSTFFSFATNQNLNLVVKNGKTVGYNIHSIAGKAKDTLTYRHAYNGAIGISAKRKADIAWVYSDSTLSFPLASQKTIPFTKDSLKKSGKPNAKLKPWKMDAAVGGGPVLVQKGKVAVSNNEELKFSGKAHNDRHPRTLIGYTKNNTLIVMLVEGRNPGIAAGVTLTEAAELMKAVGCVEALNLDGGGSSCMLINGKETIWPSDNGKQRAVPAVLMVSAVE